MSAYLARLKRLESVKNAHCTPDTEPSKLSKVPFEAFEGTGVARIEKKIIDFPKIETPLDRQRQVRRQKVIALLDSAPGSERAIYPDTTSDPDNVILAVAVRSCQQTCEMMIAKSKYDPWLLLQLVERLGDTIN